MVCIYHAIFSKANVLPNSGVVHAVKLMVQYVFNKVDHVCDVAVIHAVRYHLNCESTCHKNTEIEEKLLKSIQN